MEEDKVNYPGICDNGCDDLSNDKDLQDIINWKIPNEGTKFDKDSSINFLNETHEVAKKQFLAVSELIRAH